MVIAILDGWGVSTQTEGNAILAARTPTLDSLAQYYPLATITAAGAEVGLPWGEVGNSETGHRNIGAGRVAYQIRQAIDREISSGAFFKNEVLLSAVQHAEQHKSRLHLMGLIGPGGVHAHSSHLFALLQLLQQQHFAQPVFLHLFTDGRDTGPKMALAYVEEIEEKLTEIGIGRVASITGRLYAMDRNENRERTKATYDMLRGTYAMTTAPSAWEAVRQAYVQEVLDEKIAPTAITRGGGPLGPMQDGDAVIFFNFRPDRARQLAKMFTRQSGEQVEPDIKLVTFVEYDQTLGVPAAFKEEAVEQPLAKVIADASLKQLHISETEKYAHVTYYLNVGREQPFAGEEHVLIKSSNTHDFASIPHMEAETITSHMVQELQAGKFDVYFINYANADMVGHTGNFAAAVEACSFLDICLGQLWTAVEAAQGALIVTADHGNAEDMMDPASKTATTDHSSNPVPFYYVHPRLKRTAAKSASELNQIFTTPIGVLADVAPTILEILNLPKPVEMTGVSLLNSLN